MTKLQKKPKLLKTVKTPKMFDEDLFFYNTEEDTTEVLEVLGYNLKHSGYLEEDSRVNKYW